MTSSLSLISMEFSSFVYLRLNGTVMSQNKQHISVTLSMITGGQIRAARAALRWSVQRLADEARISTQTIKRFEVADGVPQEVEHKRFCRLRRLWKPAALNSWERL